MPEDKVRMWLRRCLARIVPLGWFFTLLAHRCLPLEQLDAGRIPGKQLLSERRRPAAHADGISWMDLKMNHLSSLIRVIFPN
jgi:hypothetical protein